MSSVRQWLHNARSVSLVQSLVPAVLATVLAVGFPGFNIWLALMAIVGVGSAHLAMNLADDFFDYRVDMLGDRDRVIRKGFRAMTVKYPYLTDGSETPKTLAIAIAAFTAFACALGAVIFLVRTVQNGFIAYSGTWWIVAIVALTAFMGVFYSAPPFKLAYHGLGEPVIGFIFGPLLMAGVFYSAAGCMEWSIFWISVPVGLLVLNILFTHSFIERPADAESNKMTFARLLRTDKANLAAAYIINFLPYLIVVAAVCVKSLHPAYLAVLAAVPRSVWLCRSLKDFSKGLADVPASPPAWLGPMPAWEPVRKAGIDWFLMRWMASRNILSAFCLLILIVKLILLSI